MFLANWRRFKFGILHNGIILLRFYSTEYKTTRSSVTQIGRVDQVSARLARLESVVYGGSEFIIYARTENKQSKVTRLFSWKLQSCGKLPCEN
ncbi:hypothetical protein RRG08_013301 [Elysia crispata]|uniref:Uncharacterized protein n=1 Tax=Elysia crispata TaxID=231223 RepID=A0AAE1AYD2_9GAST|nr:hypothetical protein RRG08_013301 [Elysia crispata]